MPFTPTLNATNVVAGFMPVLPPPVDPAELLPVSRRSLALDLRQRMEDAKYALQPSERLDELRGDQHVLKARLKHLKTPRGQGGPGLGDDDVQVLDAKRKLDALDAEMSRLNALLEPRRARSRSIAASVANCENWLREGRPGGTVIVEADIPNAAAILKRGETVAAALDRIRHRLRELAADEHRVRSAPIPSADAKIKARAEVEALAQRGAVDVGPLVEAGLSLAWPMTMQRLGLAGVVGKTGDALAGSAMGEIVDTAALLAWLTRDALVSRLEAEIDAVADDVAALSREEREMKLAEISTDRLMIERQEAALVWRLQSDGLQIEHREDCDPRAVLGVALQVVTAEPERSEPWGLAARAVQHVIEQR